MPQQKSILSAIVLALLLFGSSVVHAELNILFLGDNGHHRPRDRFDQLAPVMQQRDVRLSYTDDMVLTTPNDVGFYRDELTTYNASATWESAEGQYRFSIWGKNLSDNTERLGGTPVGGLFAFASPTQPRQYGATFVATFMR